MTIDWHQLQNPIKEADLQIISNLGCKRRSQRQFLKLLLLLILDSESLELVEWLFHGGKFKMKESSFVLLRTNLTFFCLFSFTIKQLTECLLFIEIVLFIYNKTHPTKELKMQTNQEPQRGLHNTEYLLLTQEVQFSAFSRDVAEIYWHHCLEKWTEAWLCPPNLPSTG